MARSLQKPSPLLCVHVCVFVCVCVCQVWWAMWFGQALPPSLTLWCSTSSSWCAPPTRQLPSYGPRRAEPSAGARASASLWFIEHIPPPHPLPVTPTWSLAICSCNQITSGQFWPHRFTSVFTCVSQTTCDRNPPPFLHMQIQCTHHFRLKR